MNHRVKTSLVRPSVSSYVSDRYIDILGAKVSKKTVSVSLPRLPIPVRLQMTVWDISTNRSLPGPLLDDFYRGARGVFAVCDATDPDTVRDTAAWIEGVFRHVGERPVVLVAAVPGEPSGVVVTEEDLQAVAERYGADYLFSSLGCSETTDRAFRILGERITGFALGRPGVPTPPAA